MGAETRYFVTVKKLYEDVIEVSAITGDDAIEIAKTKPDVIMVVEAKHWSEVEDIKYGK